MKKAILGLILLSSASAWADLCFENNDKHYIRIFPIGKTQVRFDYCTYDHFDCKQIGARAAYPNSLFAPAIQGVLRTMSGQRRFKDAVNLTSILAIPVAIEASVLKLPIAAKFFAQASGSLIGAEIAFTATTPIFSEIGMTFEQNEWALIDLYDQATKIGTTNAPDRCSWTEGSPDVVSVALAAKLASFEANQMADEKQIEFATREGHKTLQNTPDYLYYSSTTTKAPAANP